MKNQLLVILILAVAGCAPAPYPEAYEEPVPSSYTTTEIGIQYGKIEGAKVFNLSDVDNLYQQVSNCVAGTVVLPPRLYVITQPHAIFFDRQEHDGATSFGDTLPAVIRIYYPDWMNEYAAKRTLEHELIHAILYASGEPNLDNKNHVSPLFLTCSSL